MLMSLLGIYVIYAKYLAGMFSQCMYIYMAHMKSLAPTIQQGAVYTYLIDITE